MKVTLNDGSIKYIEVTGSEVIGTTFDGSYTDTTDIVGSDIKEIEFPVDTESTYWIWWK